ncbi:hypothetical protein TRICI_002578 [Trichomonascus ciferrii]|uniref:Exportin-1/Importin-beta-like domain-containing protein n=1 Tax=Trichomonascus ciferrii TaxID=44093 RepID=A0A642V695_9ASCO|nr:hypothetical protein TRICI_002578 [Trichomonascus ciferrii]
MDNAKSEFGWLMADRLLNSKSPQCQFFGALTFTVKLNSLTKDDLEDGKIDLNEILIQLINWLVVRKNNSPRFVIQKLISTLSVFFAKFPECWPHCVLSLVLSIQTNSAIASPETTASSGEIDLRLTEDDLFLCLQFADLLIEDQSGLSQLTSAKTIKLNDGLRKNLPIVSQLLHASLDTKAHGERGSVVNKAMSTLEGWVTYFAQSRMDISILRPFSNYLLFYLNSPDEEIYDNCSTVVIDIFTHASSFWTPEFKDSLFSLLLQQGEAVEQIKEVDDERISGFAKLLIAFFENIRKSFFLDDARSKDPKLLQLLNYIIYLTGLPGKPSVEDPIAVDCLEFWTSYVEDIEDLDVPKENHKEIVQHVINSYFPKIMFPPNNQYESWNPEDKEAFISFRRDFTDFLEYAYPIVGIELFGYLVENVYSTLNEAVETNGGKDYNRLNWEALEGSLYCINGFAEAIEGSDEAYSRVKALFSTSLLDDLPMARSTKVRQTAVNLLGSLDSFFETNDGKPYLSQALEYLFKSLRVSSLSLTASKSIQKLCASSRSSLTHLLPELMEVYKSLSLFSGLNSTAHDRTVNAIACIIQALPDLEQKAQYVDQLVGMIIEQIEEVLNNPVEQMIEWCGVLLHSLATVGKGLQIPEDVPNVSSEEAQAIMDFWDMDSCNIRKRITHVIKALAIDQEPLNNQSDICKACCDIFKAGLCEVVSGPFVFPIDTILTFITSKYRQGPLSAYSSLVDLSCCMVTSPPVEKSGSELSAKYINVLLECFFGHHIETDQEPDVQSGQLKFLTQVCQHRIALFVTHPHVEVMAQFATRMLTSNDSFVLRGACQFWCKFINNTSSGDPSIKERQGMIFQAVGPQIVAILSEKISGGAIRSDLEYYSDVVKRIIFKYPMVSKPWFLSHIVDHPISVPLARQNEKFRRDIVTRLFNLRGGRETATVIKEFWLFCRGISNYT